MVSLYDPAADELTNIFHLISAAIGKCGSIFKSVVTGRYFALYLAVFLILVIMRFIIRPLIGSAGSDGAQRKEESEDELLQKEVARQDRSARASKYREVRDAFGGK